MRTRIIAGNWKMHKTADEAKQFTEEVLEKLPKSDKVEAIICPPAVYLATLADMTKGTDLHVSAQTMHEADEGAFTGEVSPKMLKSVGVQHVVLGHSERREYYNETDETVNAKTKAAFEHGITPIVCVGETLEQRESNKTVEVVAEQVTKAFADVSAENAKEAVIAYEPIWAIGTGKTATAEDANEVCGEVRKTVEKLYGKEVADAIRIQYGGSVNPKNIEELLSTEHIDGALVGGASLEPASFLQLIEAGANA